MTEKEAMIKILDYWIIVNKLNKTIDLKHEAVKAQDFEKATKLRSEEIELRESFPGYEDLEAFKQELLNT